MLKNRSSLIGDCESADGFTLLELLVVIAIIGLLVAAAPAMLSALRPGVVSKSAANQVANDLRTARWFAVVNAREAIIIFDPPAKQYRIEPVGTMRTLAPEVGLTFQESRVATRSGPPAIWFFPDGSSSGGALVISARGQAHRVVDHALTGRIGIDE